MKGRGGSLGGTAKVVGGFPGGGLGKGREVGERGVRERSLGQVRIGEALVWGSARLGEQGCSRIGLDGSGQECDHIFL